VGRRLPFLLSVVLVVVGAFRRFSMPESQAFSKAKRTNAIAAFPLADTLRTQWREVLLAGGLFLVTSGGFYVYVTFMVAYGSTNLGLSRELTLNGVLTFAITELLVIVPVLRIFRSIGRRPVFMAAAVFTILFAFSPVLVVNTKVHVIDLPRHGYRRNIFNGVLFGIMGSFGPELFRPASATTGASLGYQLSAALSGGLTPDRERRGQMGRWKLLAGSCLARRASHW